MRRRAPQSELGTALRAQFARNLYVWRKRRGMTQQELAEAAHINRTFVSQLERGHFSVTLETIGAIAEALAVPATTLIGFQSESATVVTLEPGSRWAHGHMRAGRRG